MRVINLKKIFINLTLLFDCGAKKREPLGVGGVNSKKFVYHT